MGFFTRLLGSEADLEARKLDADETFAFNRLFQQQSGWAFLGAGAAFIVAWLACILGYGWLGFMLGWMPACVLAIVVYALWPLVAFLLVLGLAAAILLGIYLARDG